MELFVSEDEVDAGGALPVGLLRCESSPGGLKSQDSAFVSTIRSWRACVRGLDTSTTYTFSCSMANSRVPNGTVRSGLSSASAGVQPYVRAPAPPDVLHVHWRAVAEAPEIQIRFQEPYVTELRCVVSEGADLHGAIKMEGGETMHILGTIACATSRVATHMTPSAGAAAELYEFTVQLRVKDRTPADMCCLFALLPC